MGQIENGSEPESARLLSPSPAEEKSPSDSLNMGYAIYFTLGLGFLLPWNAFITAVDYFSFLYPDASVDRVFGVVYMLTCLAVLLLIVLFSHKTDNYLRINLGLSLFVVTLLAVPVIDWTYVRGRVGVYGGFDATVAAVAISGVADSLVQGGIVGSAGELPERYMQAVVAGTAASGEGIFVLF